MTGVLYFPVFPSRLQVTGVLYFLYQHNRGFVKWALKEYDGLFSTLEKYPLTDEQRNAAVVDEDRNLLIAAAGSGKSATIVAKAAYLIESGLAKSSDILVIAYNKDAQLEIDERLMQFVNKLDRNHKPIKAKTFHGLGLEIITEVEGKKPAISDIATAGKARLAKLFTGLIHEIATNNKDFAAKWHNFLTLCKTPAPDMEAIKSYRQYNDYLKERGAYWKSSLENQRRLVLKTLDGNEVKSMEELRICNWLAVNGIAYEYERQFLIQTADSTHRQYYPDFYMD